MQNLSESVESTYELRGTKLLTYDEFSKIPDDGLGHHLFRGVHIITPSPSYNHQKISMNLSLILGQYLEKLGIGELIAAPMDVKFSDSDGFQPDLLIILDDNPKIRKGQRIDGPPDLIIEILSPSSDTSDFGWKKEMAQRYGVKEYWVVDPIKIQIHIFTLEDSILNLRSIVSTNQEIEQPSLLLPGLNLNITKILQLKL